MTLQFPPSAVIRQDVQVFIHKEMAHGVILPSIVLSEFLKIAGSRIGIQAASIAVNALKDRGMKIGAINEDLAIEAGKLLIKHGNVPIADSLIAAFVSSKIGEYIYACPSSGPRNA